MVIDALMEIFTECGGLLALQKQTASYAPALKEGNSRCLAKIAITTGAREARRYLGIWDIFCRLLFFLRDLSPKHRQKQHFRC